jgi:hypothetical protein
MVTHGWTLAITLCSGEELNVIARWLNFYYISIEEWLKVSLELQIHDKIALKYASLYLARTRQQGVVLRSSLSSQISVCAPAKRARPVLEFLDNLWWLGTE